LGDLDFLLDGFDTLEVGDRFNSEFCVKEERRGLAGGKGEEKRGEGRGGERTHRRVSIGYDQSPGVELNC